jgi:hypothetical protein
MIAVHWMLRTQEVKMLTISSPAARCVVALLVMAGTSVVQGEATHRVNVVLLEEDSSLHTSVSNRDVYLLRVTPRKGTAFDAIAVDSYPPYAGALPAHLLNKGGTFSIKLMRAPYCDRASGGDGEGHAVRCFTIDHGSWKMPKNAESDLWWK